MKTKKNEHEIILKEKNGRFYLFIPELSIYSDGEELNIAYEDIVNQKQTLLSNPHSRYNPDYIISDNKNKDNFQDKIKEAIKDILPFLAKFTLIILFFLLFVFASASIISNKISMIEIMKNQVRQVVALVDRQLIEISDEEKKRRVEKFSEYAKELKPYFDSIQADKTKE